MLLFYSLIEVDITKHGHIAYLQYATTNRLI